MATALCERISLAKVCTTCHSQINVPTIPFTIGREDICNQAWQDGQWRQNNQHHHHTTPFGLHSHVYRAVVSLICKMTKCISHLHSQRLIGWPSQNSYGRLKLISNPPSFSHVKSLTASQGLNNWHWQRWLHKTGMRPYHCTAIPSVCKSGESIYFSVNQPVYLYRANKYKIGRVAKHLGVSPSHTNILTCHLEIGFDLHCTFNP